jgi:muramoyltetrapeptide carboxypeptidase
MRPPILRPPPLQPGDTIGIFTPSFPAHVHFREKYEHGRRQLAALGFRTVEGSLTARGSHQGYRSGSPRERAREFVELIENPDVRCVMSTIGGLNSASMIPYIDFDRVRAHPKVICGYSDVTSLHLALLAYSGVGTFYGPAVTPSFGEWPGVLAATRESFLDAVQRHRSGWRALRPPSRWSAHRRDPRTDEWKSVPREFSPNLGWTVLCPGRARAPALVANLDTLTTAAGTDHFPALDGVILVLEEMQASLSHEERCFRQLDLLGVFDHVAGLLVSKPERYDAEDAPFGYDALIREIVGDRPYPVVTGFDCGHTHPMLTIGQMTEMEVRADDPAGEVTVSVGPAIEETPLPAAESADRE